MNQQPIKFFVTGSLFLILGGLPALAQINLIRDQYSQTFNSLIRSDSLVLEGTEQVGEAVPISVLAGWYVAKLDGSGTADMTLNADDGSQNGGRVYSYGASGSVDRALGLKGSGTHSAAVGAAFVNRLGQTIESVTITCFHEIWSVQGTTGETASEDRLTFAYGLSGSGVTNGNFLSSDLLTPYRELDAVSPASRGLTGVVDGSNPDRSRNGDSEEWRQEISAVISGLDWEPGQTLYIRWQDTNSSGFDAGHGLEDFQLEGGGTGINQRTMYPDVGVKADGNFSDWKRPEDLYHDPVGDPTSDSGLDFKTLGASVAADGLSLYIETANPTVLSTSSLRIYLDVDGDPGTGTAFAGLGTEMMLDFSVFQSDQRFFPVDTIFYPEAAALPAGEVIADFFPNGLNATTSHPESQQFELLIPLSALRGIQPGGRLGVLLRDGVRDFAPDLGETFTIDVPYGIRPVEQLTSFDKRDPDDIRIAAYNVLVNGPWDQSKEPAFGRQIAATKPDIINFQELYDPSAAWARDFVGRWLPLEDGQWYASKNNDCITVSRFPIEHSWQVDANLVLHVDTESVWGFDSIIVNAHTPAHVENQQSRISETTNLMLLLRRLLTGAEPGTPDGDFTIFFIGDLNANSPKIELSAQRTGTFARLAYESLNYWPDDYNLPMVDAAPRQTHKTLPRLYTWRSLASGNTQRLDYIYYQQSRLTNVGAYVIETESMPDSFLQSNGLESLDSRESDHLLMIADFRKRQVDYAWEAQDVDIPGWFHSRWMGWINQFGHNDFYSPLHGYLYGKPGQSGVWLWDVQLGWWFSQAALYPYAYLQASGTWIYFYPGEETPRWYFDFASGEWKS